MSPKLSPIRFVWCVLLNYIGNTKSNQMKHLMTLLALVVAVTAGAQGTTIHEYPWNPDWNNDNFVGSSDLTGFLSAFGSEFGNPPEPCDYDGTPLEELVSGIASDDIILDSVYVEYQLEDISTYYVVGCRDPVTDTVIFSYSHLFRFFYDYGGYWAIEGVDQFGVYGNLQFHMDLTQGTYRWYIRSDAIQALTAEGFYGNSVIGSSDESSIPFPEDWYLDDNGIHIESTWSESEWPYYANYLHILPYWHYAE